VAETVDFETFCIAQNTALLRMLTLYCGDREVARDLTQETLARAWVHWRRLRKMDRGDLWLRRVALNLAKSHFRHTKVEQAARGRLLWPEEHTDGPDAGERLAVREALAHLTHRQREAVVLRFMDDFSVEQTAAVMGCSEGTVKKLTARAIVSLRDQMGMEFEVPQHA